MKKLFILLLICLSFQVKMFGQQVNITMVKHEIPGRFYGKSTNTEPDGTTTTHIICSPVFLEVCFTINLPPQINLSALPSTSNNAQTVPAIIVADGVTTTGNIIDYNAFNSYNNEGQLIRSHSFRLTSD